MERRGTRVYELRYTQIENTENACDRSVTLQLTDANGKCDSIEFNRQSSSCKLWTLFYFTIAFKTNNQQPTVNKIRFFIYKCLNDRGPRSFPFSVLHKEHTDLETKTDNTVQ